MLGVPPIHRVRSSDLRASRKLPRRRFVVFQTCEEPKPTENYSTSFPRNLLNTVLEKMKNTKQLPGRLLAPPSSNPLSHSPPLPLTTRANRVNAGTHLTY